MTLPRNHAQRVLLNDEVHARPPEPLVAPCRLSYIALICDAEAREASWRAVVTLAERCGVAPPEPGASHFSADLFAFRIKWEKHTEFVRYTFIVSGKAGGIVSGQAGGIVSGQAGGIVSGQAGGIVSGQAGGGAAAAPGSENEDPFRRTALQSVPDDWVATLPGQLMVAAHLALVADAGEDLVAVGSRAFARDVLVGSLAADASGAAFTDFRIYPDGFSRILVQDRSLTPWQAGRVAQRLLEIDTYRMMALLALPVAQSLAPVIARCEQELAHITAAMVTAGEADEPVLLDRLTRLAAEIDSRQADNLYRFSAAEAYDEIVQRRISELREERIPGLQTLQEFTERRMAPAMNTCQSVSGRQEELSRRVARATQLLATRVGVTRERQSQGLLQAVNRRIRLQIRLQQAVEGLSIAAVTYYVVGLVGYVAKGAEEGGAPIRPSMAMALSVPVVAGLMYAALRRLRRLVAADERA